MRRSRALIAALLTAALFASSSPPALGTSWGEVSEHRRAAEEARKRAAAERDEANRLAAEARALDETIDALDEELSALAPGISSAEKRTSRLTAEVTGLRARVAKTESDIASTTAEYERQSGLLASRLRSTYKQGEMFYLELLLGADDISDLVARTTLVKRVIQANQDTAIALADTRLNLQAAEEQLERDLEAVNQKRTEAAAEERRLKDMRAARRSKMEEQASVQATKVSLMKVSKANASRLAAEALAEEREAAAIAATLRARSGGSGLYAGTMTWPVPSSSRITSYYGWRTHPILGTRRFHHGLDIAARSGSAIVAAGSGEVIWAGWRGGYGKSVMIDHGDGCVTVYAHMSSIAVSVGQTVGQGQRIGAVGSTGLSTGPHLHFEVRANGESRNPLEYL